MSNRQRGAVELTIAHKKKTSASSLIVLVETLNDCSPKPTTSCIFEAKIKTTA